MSESLTSMYDCTHGPKRDCHACLIPEMAKALDELLASLKPNPAPFTRSDFRGIVRDARAVLEKAKLIEDCIPAEAALDHGHRHE